MRPRQDTKRGEIRYRQHVACATHRIAAKAAISGKDVLKDVVGRVHGEQRGREWNSIPRRLEEQACLDRSYADDAVRIHTSNTYDLQVVFVDLCQD